MGNPADEEFAASLWQRGGLVSSIGHTADAVSKRESRKGRQQALGRGEAEMRNSTKDGGTSVPRSVASGPPQ